jgi:hypothetical protein
MAFTLKKISTSSSLQKAKHCPERTLKVKCGLVYPGLMHYLGDDYYLQYNLSHFGLLLFIGHVMGYHNFILTNLRIGS